MNPYEPRVDRMSLCEGPAHIIYGQHPNPPNAPLYLFCDGAVALDLVETMRDQSAAGMGVFDSNRTDQTIECTFAPSGNLPPSALAFLIGSLGTLPMNTDLFGATDTPVKVHALDGIMYALTCAGVVELPTLLLGAANKRWDGNAKIAGTIGRNKARTDLNAMIQRLSGQPFTAVPDANECTSLACNASWGQNTIATVGGWKVGIKPTWSPRVDPNVGTFTWRLTGLVVEASARPHNLNDTIWQTPYVVGSSARIGASRIGADLILVEDNPGLTVVLRNARLVKNPLAFGENEPRLGELTWRAFRDFSAGYGELFSVTNTAS